MTKRWVTDKKIYTDVFVERESVYLQIDLIFNYCNKMLPGSKWNTAMVNNAAFSKVQKLLMKTQS